MRRLLWGFAVLFALAVGAGDAVAQTRATITGQVVDAATSAPLAGVQVGVLGTSLGTVTNTQGQYSIANVNAGTVQVRANRLGYAQSTQSVTVEAGGTTTVDFSLSPSAVALDELVVTGTAGEVSRRSQSASISTVSAASIAETAPVASMQDLISGRVAGVTLTGSSGSTGTSQQIRIRGAGSIQLSNEPLLFIDGVRADNRSISSLGIGGQATSALFDIIPEDIESIEVVKGPAAATLYGADASAGVIQIITKKGTTGATQFRQNVSLEYHDIDPNFEPYTAYASCSASLVAIANSLCGGKSVGDIVTYNALAANDVFNNGLQKSFNYNARGGGQSYGYFVSFGQDDEDGTLKNNDVLRRSARANFNFTPNAELSINAGFGIVDNTTHLPNNDNNIYGYLGVGYLGSPSTVRIQDDGSIRGGTYSSRPFEAVDAIENEYSTVRISPNLQVDYNPFNWLSNRLTVGADLNRGEYMQYFPINSNTWYQGDSNKGNLYEQRNHTDLITIDYQGTLKKDLSDLVSANLTFGSQFIRTRSDWISGTGTGFVTRPNRVIGDAEQISADQGYSDVRQLGYLSQLDLNIAEKLYLQAGARVDQFSSLGTNSPAFFLPRVGASYVISEEPFWDGIAHVIPSLRLRAAYGTTGRSPGAGAALETYNATPYAIIGGGTGAGVVPDNPGNPDLRAEKGTEFEAGADLGLFNDRLGVELTWYRKVTTDLILNRPIPPSSGSGSNPPVNIGEVLNSGFELAVNGTLIDRENVHWGARLSGSTLHNELVELGDVEPFGTSPRFDEGYQLGFFSTRTVREIITATGDSRCPTPQGQTTAGPCVIVSAENEYYGNGLPTLEGNFSSTLTLFRNLEIMGMVDWKSDYMIYNNTAQFRERSLGTAEIAVKRFDTPGVDSAAVLTRFGPFVSEEGGSVPFTAVNVAYYEPADYVRLRELSATYTLPARISTRFGASRASLTVGARNLALWSDYSGPDPEVLQSGAGAAGTGAFARQDFLTVPQPRRILVRMNLSF